MAEAEPQTLTDEHRKVLETIYDVLRTQGKWPPYEYLEVVLDRKFDIDLEKESKTIPAGLTTLPKAPYPPSPGQEIAITIEGLQHCPQAAQDVPGFFRVFRRFVEAEKSLIPTSLDSIVKPSLTTDGLSTEWSVHPNDLVRVFRVMSLEPWVEGVTASDKTIQITAGRRFRDFRTAMTIEQYLERRRQRYKPVRAGSEFRGPGDPDMYRRTAIFSGQVLETHEEKEWDVFISHANADRKPFVDGLAAALKAAGLRVWFNEFTVGDSLRGNIDQGLARSRYGIVVLSPAFFERQWTKAELGALMQRQMDGNKVILPVLHNITHDQVLAKSPLLADLYAVPSDRGLNRVVAELLRAMGRPDASPQLPAPSHSHEYTEVLSLLRQQDIAAVKKRARVLGSQLRAAVTDWLATKPVLPSTVSTKPQLESWEPIYKPLLDQIGDPLQNFVAAATAAIELDTDVLGSFVNELLTVFRVERMSSGPEGGAPQLAARLGAEILLGRAFALGRWRALIDIAKPKLNDGTKVDNWVFLATFVNPDYFGGNWYWPGLLVMELLRVDPTNDELALGAEAASAAAAEANMLLGLVNYSRRQKSGREMPYAWGYAGTRPREVVHKALDNAELVGLLAEFAGEPVSQFRERFSNRFQEMFRAANGGNWQVTLFDETIALLQEISRPTSD